MNEADRLAKAWEQGWLSAYYSDRAHEVEGRLDLEVPIHLTEDIIEWNPYREGGAG